MFRLRRPVASVADRRERALVVPEPVLAVRVLNTLPNPDEYRPEHCGQPAEFVGYHQPFGMLRYEYRCAAGCGWDKVVPRLYRHPVTGKRFFGLAPILETLPPGCGEQPEPAAEPDTLF